MVALMAVVTFAACSDSDSPDNPLQPVPGQTTKAEREMGFSCRFAEPTTRAAGDGEYTTEMLQSSGFGVYCWYTGSTHFDPAFTAPPAAGTTSHPSSPLSKSQFFTKPCAHLKPNLSARFSVPPSKP